MSDSVFIVVTDLQGNRGVFSQDDLNGSGEFVRVVLEDGQAVYVDRTLLQEQSDETYRVSADFASLRKVDTTSPAVNATEEATFPVIVEEAHIEKGWHETGTVKVSKRVVERDVVLEDMLRQETVDIKRIPVNELIASMPTTRTEGDLLIIPVVEEIVVVEKRLMLKEEIHVRRTSSQKPFQKTVTLREEQVEINRSANPADVPHASHSAD